MDVPGVREDLPLLVCELVRAGLEYFGDDVRPLPWERKLVSPSIVLPKPEYEVAFGEVSAPDLSSVLSAEALLVSR